MPKVLQFRCPTCLKLLFKWEFGHSECIFKAIGLEFREQSSVITPGGPSSEVNTQYKKQDVICSKCKTRSEIAKEGLRKVELVLKG